MNALLVLSLLAAGDLKPAISVLYFDNNTGKPELDVMRKGLADMIVTDLVAWDGVTVVERDRLEAVLTELKLQSSKKFDQATAVKVGKLVGAQYYLSGTMLFAGEQLRIDATLGNVQNGTKVTSASVTGLKDKIFDLEQDLVTRITAGIDAKLANPSARKKSKVPDFDTLLAYSKAIDLTDRGKLDEAQAAMTALVSKSPTFLMARERKEQLLEKLKEFEKRRKDMATDSVLKLGKLADEGLAREAQFDTLDEKAMRRFLTMRVIKGRFMLRVAKQFFSWRRESLRIPLKGKEGQALLAMRGWVENQRRLIDEWERFVRIRGNTYDGVLYPSSTNEELEPEEKKLLADGRFGDIHLERSASYETLARFILEGQAVDGESWFTIAPALGDVDAKEQKATLDAIDQRIDAAIAAHGKAKPTQQSKYESAAIETIDVKADALLRLDREDEAIGALQKILDLFPTSSSASSAERRIKMLLGAEHDHGRDQQERWAKAITGCDDMDIRVGMGTLDRKIRRLGLKGLDAMAKELEKGCKPSPKNRSAFAYMYKDLAMEAANHEDCEGYRAWFKKYVEADGSISDMLGYAKNYTPWCELGDVTKSVLWFTATLDRGWTLECDHFLSSVLSGDRKVLSINATDSRMGSETLYLRLEGSPEKGFKCVLTTWQRQGGTLEGTCDVKITKMAADRGEFDEGTFSATYLDKANKPARKIELSDGKFRVRRQ